MTDVLTPKPPGPMRGRPCEKGRVGRSRRLPDRLPQQDDHRRRRQGTISRYNP